MSHVVVNALVLGIRGMPLAASEPSRPAIQASQAAIQVSPPNSLKV